MRIYTAGATRANMLEHLQRYAGAPRVITFDKSRVYSSEKNVYIEDPGRDSIVRELKKRFAPVSLRGWKNIFHLKKMKVKEAVPAALCPRPARVPFISKAVLA